MPPQQFASLDAALKAHATRQPDAQVLLFVAADGSASGLTCASLNDRALRIAQGLVQRGLGPGEVIVLLLPHSPDLVAAFWGGIYARALPAILPYPAASVTPETQRAQLTTLARRAPVHHLLTTPEVRRNLDPVAAGVQCTVHDLESLLPTGDGPVDPLQTPAAPRSSAYVQFSSGTTGPQKGIVLGHAAVLNNIRAITQAVELRAEDVVVSWLPLHHDMGLVSGVLLPIVTGNLAVLISPLDWVKDPGLLFRAIHEHRASICWMPNFAFNHCVNGLRESERSHLHLESMRAFYNASEPVRLDSLDLFYEHFHPAGLRRSALGTSYGMAEVTAAVTISAPGQAAPVDWVSIDSLQRERQAVAQAPRAAGAMPLVSSGRPVAGVEVRIVDEQGSTLPERHVGEILVLSNACMSSFLPALDTPSATAWVRSGDLGYLAQGELFVTGRIKDLIISGGRNIHPEDIEAQAQGVPQLRPGRAAAFGVEDPASGTEQIVLVCETRSPLAPHDYWAVVRELRHRTQQSLAVALADVRLVEPGWIIKTSSGKIARSANREKYLSMISTSGGAQEAGHAP